MSGRCDLFLEIASVQWLPCYEAFGCPNGAAYAMRLRVSVFPGEWKLPDAGDCCDRDLSHRASKKIDVHCCIHWKAVGSFARFFPCIFSHMFISVRNSEV